MNAPGAASLAALVAAAALSACAGEPEDPQPAAPEWSVVASDLPGALLSVRGRAADDVWVTGADLADGRGGYVLHWNGAAWTRFEVAREGDVWWSSPAGPDATLFVGHRGLALRHQRGAAELEVLETGLDDTLFGVQAFSADDAWAVGGDPTAVRRPHVLLRWDGASWQVFEALPPGIPERSAFFKVWGSAPDDVWVVGTLGVALHYDGWSWTLVPAGTQLDLLTVHGHGGHVFAVGGRIRGALVSRIAGEHALASAELYDLPQLFGVWCRPDGRPTVVGSQGFVAHMTAADALEIDEDAPETPQDYHAVFVDPEGGIWGVGGHIVVPPFIGGMLNYRGPQTLAPESLADLL